MKETQNKFITTTFEETAEQLAKLGFVLLSHSGNTWTFLNNSKVPFAKMKNVAYTDKLFT